MISTSKVREITNFVNCKYFVFDKTYARSYVGTCEYNKLKIYNLTNCTDGTCKIKQKRLNKYELSDLRYKKKGYKKVEEKKRYDL